MASTFDLLRANDFSYVTSNWLMGGQHLSLQDVKSDACVVRAERPHRAMASLLQGDPRADGNVRYVLSNGGHVAGIVSPPGAVPGETAGDYIHG